ncbi:MAG: Lrp/AsnC ligand binding domain-containing protein [Promethearchaeota archaeon]
MLEELYKDSRIKDNELSKLLGLSRQTISKMRHSLWKKHYIHNPTILINPLVLNMQHFFMEIKTNPSEPKILKTLSSSPDFFDIVAIDGILGEYSLMIKVETQTKKNFADLLTKYDQEIGEYSSFHSYKIIEAIDIYKLGGFIIDRVQINRLIKDDKWTILDFLRKNNNPHRWPIRSEDKEMFRDHDLSLIENINLSREFNTMLENGIIQRFTITMKNFKSNLATKFYIRIKPDRPGNYVKLATKLCHNPYIIDLYRTGEEAGLLAVVRTKNLESFNKFVQNLYQNYDVVDSHTTVVIEENKPTIYPPTLKVAHEVCKCD